MRKNGKCPKCDGKRFFVIDEASVPNYESSNGVEPFSIATAYVDSGVSGLLGNKRDRFAANVEAWVCASCELTEFYVKDLSLLQAFADAGEAKVRVVDYETPKNAPFR